MTRIRQIYADFYLWPSVRSVLSVFYSPVILRKPVIIHLRVFQQHIRKNNHCWIRCQGFEAGGVAGGDDEDFALGVGEGVGVYVEVFWRLLPVVDLYPVDEEAAFGDVEVLGFEFVALPGTSDVGVWVGDGVEAFYIFKMKIVNESYNSTLIFMNVAFDKLHINGTQMTLMLLICADFYLWQSAWSVLSVFYS